MVNDLFKFLTYIAITNILFPFSLIFCQNTIQFIDINTSAYPHIKGTFFAVDSHGKIKSDFTLSDLKIYENGIQQSAYDLQCEPPTQLLAISSIITIDISGSMIGARLASAQAAAREWVRLLDTSISECAITTFNHQNYLVQDFTKDKQTLYRKINLLKAGGGTDYNAAFLDPPAGALKIAEKAAPNKKKILLFITDGVSDANEKEIISLARSLNITIYCLFLGTKAPDVLYNLSKSTGGMVWGDITTEDQATAIFTAIMQLSGGRKPCAISWKSSTCSPFRTLKIETDNFQSIESNYFIYHDRLPTLEIYPTNFHYFGIINKGNTAKHQIKLTAKNDSIIIDNISSNSIFRVNFEKKPPILIPKDSSITIELEYAPTDTSYNSFDYIITGDNCFGKVIWVAGGYTKGSTFGGLQITFPNGNEKIIAGYDTTIKWRGVLPTDSVMLELSEDSGKTWSIIEKKASKLEYIWKIDSDQPVSDKCLIRGKYISNENSNIYYLKGHTGVITTIDWNLDDKELVSGGDDGFLILWEPINKSKPNVLIRTLGNIHCIRFSNDKVYFAVSYGNSVSIWKKTADEWRKFLDLDNQGREIVSLDWSPDGFFLAGGDKEGNIIIWEFPNKPIVASTKIHNDKINAIKWISDFNDGRFLATISNDGFLKIWNYAVMNSPILVKEYDHNSRINTLDWSKDKSKIAIGAYDIIIFSYPELSIDTIINLKNTRINTLGFSADNQYLAAGGSDKTVNLFKLSGDGWENIYNFRGHTDDISVIRWNNSQSIPKLASGSYDTWIEIWSPKDIPLDEPMIFEDVSDNVWSIVHPVLELNDVYFDETEVNTTREVLFSPLLTNISTVPIRIDSISISGINSSEFSISFKSFPIYLEPANKLSANISFNPKSVGIRQAQINVYYGRYVKQANILGEGLKQKLMFLQKEIDFGKVLIQASKTVDEVIIKNISSLSLKIDSIKIISFEPDIFRIISVNNEEYFWNKSIYLKNNSEMTIKLEFTPRSTYRYSAGIAIYYSEMNTDFIPQILLYGEGIDFTMDVPRTVLFNDLKCEPNRQDTSIIIRNFGNESITIISAEMQGEDPEDFSFDDKIIGTIISPLTSKYFGIASVPSTYGPKSAILKIKAMINSENTKEFSIFLSSRTDYWKLQIDEFLDFGVIPEYENKYLNIYVRNIGTLNYVWKFPLNKNNFTLESVKPSITQPNDSSLLTFKFTGDKAGVYNGIFMFDDSCGNVYELMLTANVHEKFAQLSSYDIINFGVYLCSINEVDSTIIIKNTGNDTLKIDKIKLNSNNNGNKHYILIPESISDLMLLPEESFSFEVRYVPNNLGKHIDTIEIITNAVNSIDGKNEIILIGQTEKIFYEVTDTIKFEKIFPGEKAKNQMKILSKSTIPSQINLIRSNLNYFEIDSEFPIEIMPGEEKSIDIVFKGDNEGKIISENFELIDTCGTIYTIFLSAEVISIPTINIFIPEICGYPNEVITVPIRILNFNDYYSNLTVGFYTELVINSNLLQFAEDYSGIIKEEENIILPLSLPSKPIKADILTEIKVIIIAKFSDSTDLILQNTKATNSNLKVLSDNGKLIIGCGNELNEVIMQKGNLILYQNFPNPFESTTTIIYELLEDDNIEIVLYNVEPKYSSFKILNKSFFKKGKYQIILNLTEFSQGHYYYTLSNGRDYITGKMIILK